MQLLFLVGTYTSESVPSWERRHSWMDFIAVSFVIDIELCSNTLLTSMKLLLYQFENIFVFEISKVCVQSANDPVLVVILYAILVYSKKCPCIIVHMHWVSIWTLTTLLTWEEIDSCIISHVSTYTKMAICPLPIHIHPVQTYLPGKNRGEEKGEEGEEEGKK